MKNNDLKMTSVKPYLIRAFHEWITSNGLTPYIDVNTKIPNTKVPQEYIRDNKITLNVASSAVKELSLGNKLISFYARFSGVVEFIELPIRAVLAIYAKENGHGHVFNEKEEDEEASDFGGDSASSSGKGKPVLKIVK